MHKLNYERSPTTEAKLIVIKYFVTNHIAVTRKTKLQKKKKQSGRSKLFCCTVC